MHIFLRRTGNWLWMLFLIPLLSQAKTFVIEGQQLIDRPIVYSDAILDFSHGSFYITNNATVTIQNSTIHGTVSPENPSLYQVSRGRLVLKNNRIRIHAENLPQNPFSPPSQFMVRLKKGEAYLINNDFRIDQPYTAGLFIEEGSQPGHFWIADNKIQNFHGGIYAIGSRHSLISGNAFTRVSNANIYALNAFDLAITRNTILFSGNNNVGDSMDIIDSDNIRVRKNHIFDSTCYSIFIMRSSNVQIEKNDVSHGITFAVFATNSLSPQNENFAWLSTLNRHYSRHRILNQKNTGLFISDNLLSQNRFGLSINHADGVIVKNNIFVQRFIDNKSRQFWTNNDILFQDITHLVWEKNQYKEAFTQSLTDRNDQSLQFVPFPEHNGVIF